MTLSFDFREGQVNIKKTNKKLETETDELEKDKDCNAHQLESYHKMYLEKVKNIHPATSEPEAFNAVGQLQTLERIVKTGELKYDRKKELSSDKPKS